MNVVERRLALVAVELGRHPHRHMALRSDHRRRDLRPISVGAEQIEDVHPRLQAEELQHLRRLAAFVELDVVGVARGDGDRSGDARRRLAARRRQRSSDEAERAAASLIRRMGFPLEAGRVLLLPDDERAPAVTRPSLIGVQFSINVAASGNLSRGGIAWRQSLQRGADRKASERKFYSRMALFLVFLVLLGLRAELLSARRCAILSAAQSDVAARGHPPRQRFHRCGWLAIVAQTQLIAARKHADPHATRKARMLLALLMLPVMYLTAVGRSRAPTSRPSPTR